MVAPASEVEQSINQYQLHKRKKSQWNDHWQLLGEYIHTRKQEFTTDTEAGDFLNRDLFDSTGPRAAKISTSSLISMLWPQTAKKIRFRPPDSIQRESRAVKEYYEKITERQLRVMDNPEAAFATSLEEYMLDQMVFATSGIEVLKDEKTKVMYRPWGVKNMTINEGKNGRVNTVYIEIEWDVGRVVSEYGIDRVSEKIRQLFNNGSTDRPVKILIAIEPRLKRDRAKKGNRSMPWRSQHIELESKHRIKVAGFDDIPIKVGRFTKLIGEKYGRGFGMDALPDILELNALWESVTIAIEKSLDPPLGVLDDGVLGAQVIDTSAGAINVFTLSGRAGEKNPIFPLFTIGEFKQAFNLIEKLEQTIQNHFSLDRLLDFNNETQMTLGEAQIRNRLRNATLATIFSRQIMELFTPVIERTFNLLLEQGEFGFVKGSPELANDPDALVIPPEVAKLMASGKDVYRIEYLTPAQRIMEVEEAEGILRTWEMAQTIAPMVPEVADNLDADESIRRFREVVGGPSTMERAKTDVDAIRAGKAEAVAQAEQGQQALQATEGIRNIGQSGLPIPGLQAA